MVQNRQTRAPVFTSYASTNPRISNSPPAPPTITFPSATSDASLKAAEDQLSDYLCRIQVRSEKIPYLDGAWFRADDVTQVDDQQHAVSALLAALLVLEDPA